MSSGLQELMAAEQRAAQIIQAARSERTEKMKQAQQEAQQVIEEYRSEKETALQKQATQNVSSSQGWQLRGAGFLHRLLVRICSACGHPQSDKSSSLNADALGWQQGGEGGDFEQLKSESEQQLQGLRSEFASNKDRAIDFLVKVVTDVDPQFPEDIRTM
eukprot:scaffold1147_cov250-Pinguiococcus_pyrenoidosus.AAC.1